MKKIRCIQLLIAICLIFNVSVKAQDPGFTLRGKIKNIQDGVQLCLVKKSSQDTVARSVTKDEEFVFKGKIDNESDFYWISMDTLVSGIPSNAIWLVNANVSLNTSVEEWPIVHVNGSEPQRDFEEYLLIYSLFQKKKKDLLDSISMNGGDEAEKRFNNAKQIGDSTVMKQMQLILTRDWDLLNEGNRRLSLDKANMTVQFIEGHLNSLYSPFVILNSKSLLTDIKIKSLYDQLTRRSKHSFYGLQLMDLLDAGVLQVGGLAGNFNGVTPEGKTLSLDEVLSKGKYTLLDFWASWCKPCRLESPNLKRAYDLYHYKGFNILSITSDNKISNWKNAIVQDSINWFHISDRDMSAAISKMYNINVLPAWYLLDASGKIIASDNPLQGTSDLTDGKLEKKLSELLNMK